MNYNMIFGDTHIEPHTDLTPLGRLGELAVKKKAGVLICVGDFTDFASQAWMKKARGKYTLTQELNATRKALAKFEQAIHEYNKERRRQKKKMYKPRKIICKGNHDARVSGDAFDKIFRDAGWEVYQYREVIEVEGIFYSHIFENGTSGRACVDVEDILNNTHAPSFSGHGHRFAYAGDTDSYGNKIFAVKCPCLREDYPEWAGQGATKWDRGFIMAWGEVFTMYPIEVLK